MRTTPRVAHLTLGNLPSMGYRQYLCYHRRRRKYLLLNASTNNQHIHPHCPTCRLSNREFLGQIHALSGIPYIWHRVGSQPRPLHNQRTHSHHRHGKRFFWRRLVSPPSNRMTDVGQCNRYPHRPKSLLQARFRIPLPNPPHNDHTNAWLRHRRHLSPLASLPTFHDLARPPRHNNLPQHPPQPS
jgi:hypothetical protein